MRAILTLLGIWILLLTVNLQAQNPDPHRFDQEIEAFVRYDEKNSFPKDAVLFVGSSSIRLWKTHLAFPDLPVINRGFGGAHISDVLFFYNQVVQPYQPRIIVFYAGDNDIAAGKSVEQVVNDFKTFVQKVKNDFPQTKIVFLPIKPSVLRWKFWPEMRKTNQKIEALCQQNPNLFYIDLTNVLLDDQGQPKANLFLQDGLHLNPNGYQKWNKTLSPLLHKLFKNKP